MKKKELDKIFKKIDCDQASRGKQTWCRDCIEWIIEQVEATKNDP
jgi:hypothetical protein